MKYIKYLVFTVAIFFISCDTEEFLNPIPDTVVVEESFFQTDADVEAGLFGVYDALDVVGDLYNNGEALFFANTGVLSKPMTKHDEWVKETSFQLFAHNTMVSRLVSRFLFVLFALLYSSPIFFNDCPTAA